MAKAKKKYDIKFKKDTNGSNSGEMIIKMSNGSFYHLSFSSAPDTKIRAAKAEINDYFEHRIPEFLEENPGATPITWDEYSNAF